MTKEELPHCSPRAQWGYKPFDRVPQYKGDKQVIRWWRGDILELCDVKHTKWTCWQNSSSWIWSQQNKQPTGKPHLPSDKPHPHLGAQPSSCEMEKYFLKNTAPDENHGKITWRQERISLLPMSWLHFQRNCTSPPSDMRAVKRCKKI